MSLLCGLCPLCESLLQFLLPEISQCINGSRTREVPLNSRITQWVYNKRSNLTYICVSSACIYCALTMSRTIRLVEAKLVPSNRPKATPRKLQIKCSTTRRALFSGHGPLGQPCFHGQERRVVSAASFSQMPGSIVSTGSLQQRFVEKISHKQTSWPYTSGPRR